MPGYPASVHGADAVLFRATVVSMVPAAPLLPTTEPDSAAVAHRTGPAAALVVEALDDVVVTAPVVVEPLAVGGGPLVVVGVEDPDEQALKSMPLSRIAVINSVAITTGLDTLDTLIDRPRPSRARRLHTGLVRDVRSHDVSMAPARRRRRDPGQAGPTAHGRSGTSSPPPA